MSMGAAHEIEARAMGWSEISSSEWPPPPTSLILRAKETYPAESPFIFNHSAFATILPASTCQQPHHSAASNMTQLNWPVFIATDAHSPRSNPSLQLFLRTLPCSFFLSDFTSSHLKALDLVTNEDDGLPLKGFLLPFVDSVVAAMAQTVIGTPHSTFSRFTVDVMNRMYHGLPIIERGR